MKAKEYAEEFLKTDFKVSEEVTNKAVSDITIKFFNEINDIRLARHVTKDIGLASIVKEQNQKWNAFCRIVNKVLGVELMRLDGFRLYMLEIIPDLKNFEKYI